MPYTHKPSYYYKTDEIPCTRNPLPLPHKTQSKNANEERTRDPLNLTFQQQDAELLLTKILPTNRLKLITQTERYVTDLYLLIRYAKINIEIFQGLFI